MRESFGYYEVVYAHARVMGTFRRNRRQLRQVISRKLVALGVEGRKVGGPGAKLGRSCNLFRVQG